METSKEKLGIDSVKIQGRHLQNLPLEELQQEKKNVKNELKHYDASFIN